MQIEIQDVNAWVETLGVTTGARAFRPVLHSVGSLELVAPHKHTSRQLRQRRAPPLLPARFVAGLIGLDGVTDSLKFVHHPASPPTRRYCFYAAIGVQAVCRQSVKRRPVV